MGLLGSSHLYKLLIERKKETEVERERKKNLNNMATVQHNLIPLNNSIVLCFQLWGGGDVLICSYNTKIQIECLRSKKTI